MVESTDHQGPLWTHRGGAVPGETNVQQEMVVSGNAEIYLRYADQCPWTEGDNGSGGLSWIKADVVTPLAPRV